MKLYVELQNVIVVGIVSWKIPSPNRLRTDSIVLIAFVALSVPIHVVLCLGAKRSSVQSVSLGLFVSRIYETAFAAWLVYMRAVMLVMHVCSKCNSLH